MLPFLRPEICSRKKEGEGGLAIPGFRISQMLRLWQDVQPLGSLGNFIVLSCLFFFIFVFCICQVTYFPISQTTVFSISFYKVVFSFFLFFFTARGTSDTIQVPSFFSSFCFSTVLLSLPLIYYNFSILPSLQVHTTINNYLELLATQPLIHTHTPFSSRFALNWSSLRKKKKKERKSTKTPK